MITKYKDHHVNLNNIEEVDFVWRDENYSELTGKSKYYDWIIASHVIEHTPDLIGFLNDCDAILKDEGVILSSYRINAIVLTTIDQLLEFQKS